MAKSLALATHIGPIRIHVNASEPVKLQALAAPLSVRVLGVPGPQGREGAVGPQGLQGAPGNLEAGIVIDGGNF